MVRQLDLHSPADVSRSRLAGSSALRLRLIDGPVAELDSVAGVVTLALLSLDCSRSCFLFLFKHGH